MLILSHFFLKTLVYYEIKIFHFILVRNNKKTRRTLKKIVIYIVRSLIIFEVEYFSKQLHLVSIKDLLIS